MPNKYRYEATWVIWTKSSISSKTDELAKSLDEKTNTNNLSEVEKVEFKELVAGAVAEAQQTSSSAQAIVDKETQSAEEENKAGVVEGDSLETSDQGNIQETNTMVNENSTTTTEIKSDGENSGETTEGIIQ